MKEEPAAVLAGIAGAIGARDLFVLHRVTPERLVNLDGHGRGRGWAGNVSVDASAEPWLARTIDLGMFRARYGFPCRIFGPYWADEAAAALCGDYVVVAGGDGVASAPDSDLLSVARRAAEHVGEVPPAKRLADELEVTQAELSIASFRPSSVEEAASGIASRAAEALSCEFGAILLEGAPPRLHLAEQAWRPAAPEEEIVQALLPLREPSREGLLVEQDMSCSRFPYRPLAFEDGLVARCAVPLGTDGDLGLLVVGHAAGAPRGFTSLCQQVIVRIARAATPVLEQAAAS